MTADASVSFIEKILEESGLNELPPEYKEQYTAKLQEQLNRRIGLIILENLSPEDSEKFADKLNASPAPSTEEMNNYFIEKIPDLNDKIRDGLTQFAAEFISSVKNNAQKN